MAKEKSLKLRTIISFRTLHKNSDQNHRMTSRKMNTFLKPFELKISGVGLNDDIRILKEFGVDAHTNEGPQGHCAYIKDHLLTDQTLQDLVYAVSSNPHLSSSQATEILAQLKPLVTVYQEPLLQSFMDFGHQTKPDDALYYAYLVTKEAIENKRRILYTIDYAKYNKEDKTIDQIREWETMFTPKYLYKTAKSLYCIGFNNTDKRIECIDLKKTATIRLSLEYKENKDLVERCIAPIPLQDHAPKEDPHILYEGPAIFRCFVSNIKILHDLFGEPGGPVEQSYNLRTTYPVEHAVITTEIMTMLAGMAQNGGLQIIGPEALQTVVSEYFATLGSILLSNKFARKRSKRASNV